MKMLCAATGFFLGESEKKREKGPMCCRYVLLNQHLNKVLKQLGVGRVVDAPSRYNLAPGTKIPAVRSRVPRGGDGGGSELASLRWGLVPAWTKGSAAGAGLANARAESLAEKPSFREAFARRRCLIPASGFYEWKRSGRARQPWLFQLRDEEPFFLAGLWEAWRGLDGGELETCAVVTTAPNQLMEPIHDRLPAIVPVGAASDWLDPETPVARLSELLAPFPAEKMMARPLSDRVNSVANDDEGCLAPAEPGQVNDQLGLGF